MTLGCSCKVGKFCERSSKDLVEIWMKQMGFLVFDHFVVGLIYSPPTPLLGFRSCICALILNPLHAGLFSTVIWRSRVRTLLMEFVCTARNQIYSHFSSPGWNFIILGLLERSGPSESILEALSSTRATSMTSPNWPTMPRNETTTQSQILFRLLAQIQPIFTIQTALQS